MNLQQQKQGNITIVNFEGRFDINQSLEAEKTINAILDKDEKFLIINLEKTEYLSSSGLRVIISTMRRIKGLNGQLKLAGMNGIVKRTFQVVGLLEIFENYTSIEKALESFK